MHCHPYRFTTAAPKISPNEKNQGRTFPRMVQAGNANRRDDPYDREIRPYRRTPPGQMDHQYCSNFGVFACTDLLPEDANALQIFFVTTVLCLLPLLPVMVIRHKLSRLNKFFKLRTAENQRRRRRRGKGEERTCLRPFQDIVRAKIGVSCSGNREKSNGSRIRARHCAAASWADGEWRNAKPAQSGRGFKAGVSRPRPF